jgi:hypothetical protein
MLASRWAAELLPAIRHVERKRDRVSWQGGKAASCPAREIIREEARLESGDPAFSGPDARKSLPQRALAAGRHALRTGLSGALAIIYPPCCIACQAAVGQAQALCPSCWGAIGFIERPYCERLGTPFAIDLGPGLLSPAAIADPPVFARARAVCRFDGVARELVHRLKYGDRTELALTLGRMMAQAGRELLADADLIVPVPLHRTRLWSRW